MASHHVSRERSKCAISNAKLRIRRPTSGGAVTWVRTFRGNRQRRFDAYMIYSEQRSCIIDYLGTHQHLAVDIELRAAPNGGLSYAQVHNASTKDSLGFPFPMLFSGVADVCECYDDAERQFKIKVNVTNKVMGTPFRIQGPFSCRLATQSDQRKFQPADILPIRTQKRNRARRRRTPVTELLMYGYDVTQELETSSSRTSCRRMKAASAFLVRSLYCRRLNAHGTVTGSTRGNISRCRCLRR